MVGPSRPQFVLFGSSIVQFSFSNGGWGANLADIYARKADILVRGYSGWNSRRALAVLDKVFPKDAALQPSLIIVYFGGNDSMGAHPSGLGPHVPLPEYAENMRKIATYLKDLSDTTRIVFLSTPPVDEAFIKKTKVVLRCSSRRNFHLGSFGNSLFVLLTQGQFLSDLVRTNEICGKYSEALIELCREMDLKVIDLWTTMQKRDDWLTSVFTDGIHLSAEGSQIVTEEILKTLKEAEWEPSLHWKSMPTEFSEDSLMILYYLTGSAHSIPQTGVSIEKYSGNDFSDN